MTVLRILARVQQCFQGFPRSLASNRNKLNLKYCLYHGVSMKFKHRAYLAVSVLLLLATVSHAQQQKPDAEESQSLVKAIQNPVASLVSVPIQENVNPNIGPFDRTQTVLNIQPVIPISNCGELEYDRSRDHPTSPAARRHPEKYRRLWAGRHEPELFFLARQG